VSSPPVEVVDACIARIEERNPTGAILVGKTNSPVLGFRGITDNEAAARSGRPTQASGRSTWPALRDHRLNCLDKTAYWGAVHRMLARHAPAADRADECTGCESAWPWRTITSAVADIRNGSLGY
jgi:hypothetical protein